MMISILLVIALLCVAFYAYRVMAQGNALALPLLLLSFTGIFFVFFPEETIVIANKLGVGRGTDLLLYLCFVTGSILIVLIHIKFRHQSIEITELARAIALANPMRPDKTPGGEKANAATTEHCGHKEDALRETPL